MSKYIQTGRCLLDMDGVICNTMASVFETLHIERGISICHADIDDYWFSGLPVQTGDILDIMKRDGFYRHLDVITGAVEAVRRLREQYDVVVCSAPLKGHNHAEDEKREWLAEHFDKDFAESAIITSDKARVMGRVLIEDNPFIDRDANWRPVMLDQAWNRNVTDLPRMYGWHDLSVVEEAMR